MSGHALAKVTLTAPRPDAPKAPGTPGTPGASHAPDAPDAPRRTTVDQDWRFAELTAQCYLDPALAVRYAVEPRGVLEEFGIAVDETTEIPALPADRGSEVTITSLDPRSAPGHAMDCHTWTFAPPEGEGALRGVPHEGVRSETPPV